MKSLLLALALAAGVASAAQAQSPQVLASCGTASLPVGTGGRLFIDTTGTLCTVAGGGGGGGGATGSVTPAGTSGTSAQAIQGITGGVPVPVTGSFSAAAAPGAQEQDVRTTQTLNAATLNAAVTVPINGQGTLGFNITGLTASGATLTFEQSEDAGTTWTIVNEVNAGTGVATSTRTTDGQSRIAASGRTNIRFRVSAVGTGTVTINTNVSVREGMVTIASPVLTGQYNSTLPTLASGGYGVVAIDVNGRQILSPSSTINVGNFPATQPVSGSVSVSNFPASQAVADYGTDGTTQRQIRTTTTGVLEPPTAASGKITKTTTTLAASTSTTLAAANTNRIALGIQCATGGVSIDETGAALTGAAVGNGTLFIPAGTAPYFTPPVATQTAVTAYTATGQACVVTEYLR